MSAAVIPIFSAWALGLALYSVRLWRVWRS